MLEFKKDVDIIQLLKANGYSSYRIRKEKIIPEGSMQRIRNRTPIGWETIETLCRLLHFQPSDFLVYVEDEKKTDRSVNTVLHEEAFADPRDDEPDEPVPDIDLEKFL